MVISIPPSPCHLQPARCGLPLPRYIIQGYVMGDKKNADPTLLISEPVPSHHKDRSTRLVNFDPAASPDPASKELSVPGP